MSILESVIAVLNTFNTNNNEQHKDTCKDAEIICNEFNLLRVILRYKIGDNSKKYTITNRGRMVRGFFNSPYYSSFTIDQKHQLSKRSVHEVLHYVVCGRLITVNDISTM